MIFAALCSGPRPRTSAKPCPVINTCVLCSVWSTWGTIGTTAETAMPLAVLRAIKIGEYALRAKSPDPPIPFIIIVPFKCVLLADP